MSGTAAARRAIAFRHAVHGLVCDREQPWEHGTVVSAADLPSYYTYNSVRVEDDAAGLTAGSLVAAADRLQAGLAHRQVEVEDPVAGVRLRPDFGARGWVTERLAWMELEGEAAGGAGDAAVAVAEVPFADTRALREAWFATSPLAGSPSAQRGFLVVEERVATRRGTRALTAGAPGGDALGFAAFSVLGDTAEIEQLYVRPEARDAGLGGALVRAAVAAAGAARTWIVAEDGGAPQRLYARLGFVAAWTQHVFTRAPGT
jgi:ribosomal protein S18 acetylase RimI-like enzyme